MVTERRAPSIDQAIAATREKVVGSSKDFEQKMDEAMRALRGKLEDEMLHLWADVDALELQESIWGIVANPDNAPEFIKLLDSTKAVRAPERPQILVVKREDGSYYLHKYLDVPEMDNPDDRKFCKHALWALKALDRFLGDQAEYPKRSDYYYERLKTDLKKRFANRGLNKIRNMGNLTEEQLLTYEEAQVVLWVVGNSPKDIDEVLKGYHSMVSIKVMHDLRENGYIHRPDINGPIVLTSKGEDYLASRKEQ
jgi:hypothetical protein